VNKRPFEFPPPATPPDEGAFHTCQFNTTWLPVLLSVAGELADISLWDNPPSDMIAQVHQFIEQLQKDIPAVQQIFPTAGLHFHQGSIVTNGNAIAPNIDTAQWFNTYARQNAPAINDSFEWTMLLEAGDYKLDVIWIRAVANGYLSWSFEGNAPGDIDMYGTTARNMVTTFDITLEESKLQTFLGYCLGKNPSSTGYQIPVTCFQVRKV
jgi:hypothetical protein